MTYIVADVNAITPEKVDGDVENEKASVGEAKVEVGLPPLPYQPERQATDGSETRVSSNSENSKGELPGYEDAAQPQVDRGVDADGDEAKNVPAPVALPQAREPAQAPEQEHKPEDPVEYFEPRAAYDFADEDVDSASEYSNESGVGADVHYSSSVHSDDGERYYYETRGRLTPCAEDEELDEFEGHENEDAEDLERVWVEVLEEQRRAQEASSAMATGNASATAETMGTQEKAKAEAGMKNGEVNGEGKEQLTKKKRKTKGGHSGGKSEGTPCELNLRKEKSYL